MNHRQWKKHFKKTHSRNPYPFEDKNARGTYANVFYNQFSKDLHDAIENICDAYREALNALASAVGEFARSISDIMKGW